MRFAPAGRRTSLSPGFGRLMSLKKITSPWLPARRNTEFHFNSTTPSPTTRITSIRNSAVNVTAHLFLQGTPANTFGPPSWQQKSPAGRRRKTSRPERNSAPKNTRRTMMLTTMMLATMTQNLTRPPGRIIRRLIPRLGSTGKFY